MPNNTPNDNKIPYGYCHCGCGELTQIAKKTDNRYGWIKGHSKPFLNSTHAKRHSINGRFWEKVNRRSVNECWEWQAHKDKKGYGNFRIHGRMSKAHRYSYTIHKGAIPDGLFVCHACDNPSCVNPNHLWVGDAQANANDMVSKGRANRNRGTKHHNAMFTEKQIAKIRCDHFQNEIGVIQLARENGAHRSTIRRLLRKITYQDT